MEEHQTRLHDSFQVRRIIYRLCSAQDRVYLIYGIRLFKASDDCVIRHLIHMDLLIPVHDKRPVLRHENAVILYLHEIIQERIVLSSACQDSEDLLVLFHPGNEICRHLFPTVEEGAVHICCDKAYQ